MLPVSRKLRLLDSMKGRGSALCKITGHMLREHRAGKHFTSNSMTQYTSCLALARDSLLRILLPAILLLTVADLVIGAADPVADDNRINPS
jgi:hypothetical protein